MTEALFLGQNAHTRVALHLDKANRHGLITGATGTGKTVTLQAMAQAFSTHGIPVFLADVKGDLSGLAQSGHFEGKFAEVLSKRGIAPPEPQAAPVAFWDVLGEQGHPVRATVSDMGPLLLARMLGLNDTQLGVLTIVFKVADEQGLALLDLKDLRAMCAHVADHAKALRPHYGNISAASVGAIQRQLLQLESQGADLFFGEPILNIHDLMRLDAQGRGVINILAADRLLHAPKLYASFLLWLLSELFEALPEVGDLEQPRLVFFFDEAHLLFDGAPEALLDRFEMVVRLIRSKGVGVYLVTQSPSDIPDNLLGQLGHRVQHALRAYTPRDQKAVRAAAQTMRPHEGLDIEQAITELAIGEALVSFLDDQGRPEATQRVFMLPPASHLGPIAADARARQLQQSPLAGIYDLAVDRESAYERLQAQAAQAMSPQTHQPDPPNRDDGALGSLSDWLLGSKGPRGRQRDGLAQVAIKSAVRTMGTQLGRQIVRGILGSMVGSRRR